MLAKRNKDVPRHVVFLRLLLGGGGSKCTRILKSVNRHKVWELPPQHRPFSSFHQLIHTQSQIEHYEVFLWCLTFTLASTSRTFSLDADGHLVEALSCSCNRGGFFVGFLYVLYSTLLHLLPLIFQPVSPDAGVEPSTIATLVLAVGGSNHSARSHPSVVLLLYCGAYMSSW